MEKKKTNNRFSSGVRERAVRMEHRGDYATQWAAMVLIAVKIGCTGQTLRGWVRQAERDAGSRLRMSVAIACPISGSTR